MLQPSYSALILVGKLNAFWGFSLFSVARKSLKITTQRAFTLAEVLITLGIIGIVAAMTIPDLVTNYQKNRTAVLLKKSYADLQNAVKLSVTENDNPGFWVYPTGQDDRDGTERYLKQYWLPFFKGSSMISTSDKRLLNYKLWNLDKSWGFDPTASLYTISLSDGRLLSFRMNNLYGYIWLLLDINGFSNPNVFGKDIFVFDAYNFINNGSAIKFWGQGGGINFLKSNSTYGCARNVTGTYKGYYCGEWIRQNNWSVPKDYPW